MSLNFVCVMNSGGVFNHTWTQRLCRQVAKHLDATRIVCLTDDFNKRCPVMIGLDHAVLLVPLRNNWPGWFSKMELFRPGLFEGPCLYMDLDTLILKPIPDLRAKLDDALAQCPLIMLDDLGVSHMPASGVMAWLPGRHTETIYRSFAARPRFYPRWDRGDGYYIGQVKHLRWQTLFPGTVASYRLAKLHGGPNGAAICCFHGAEKNHSFPAEHWVTKKWLGIE